LRRAHTAGGLTSAWSRRPLRRPAPRLHALGAPPVAASLPAVSLGLHPASRAGLAPPPGAAHTRFVRWLRACLDVGPGRLSLRRLAVLVLTLVAGCGGPTLAPNAEYASRIGERWHPVTVGAEQASLASGADTVGCHVKAYGWKLLDLRRVKTIRDAWFQRGRPQQKWGWKLLVHNAGDNPLIVHIAVGLMPAEDMSVARSAHGSLSRAKPIGTNFGDPSPEPGIPKNLVKPGETRLFSDTSWYWLDEHSKEGRPDRIRWTIEHRGLAPGSRSILQEMAVRNPQPSN